MSRFVHTGIHPPTLRTTAVPPTTADMTSSGTSSSPHRTTVGADVTDDLIISNWTSDVMSHVTLDCADPAMAATCQEKQVQYMLDEVLYITCKRILWTCQFSAEAS